jgi:hypothetical protein
LRDPFCDPVRVGVLAAHFQPAERIEAGIDNVLLDARPDEAIFDQAIDSQRDRAFGYAKPGSKLAIGHLRIVRQFRDHLSIKLIPHAPHSLPSRSMPSCFRIMA